MHPIGIVLLTLALGGDPTPPNPVPLFRPPAVSLTVGDDYGYGDLAIITAAVDESRLPDNLASMQFAWLVFDEQGKEKSVFTGEGGRSIAFAIGIKPTTITVVCNVNCLFEVKKSVTIVDSTGKPVIETIIADAASVSPKPLRKVISVGGVVPTPPTPNLPQGTYGLAPFVYQTFSASGDMNDAEKAAVAKALAIGFGGIAAKINANPAYGDIPTIIADLKVYNDQNLAGTDVPAAKTAVVQSILKARVGGLVRDQKIITASQFATAFQEIARGLTAVANK